MRKLGNGINIHIPRSKTYLFLQQLVFQVVFILHALCIDSCLNITMHFLGLLLLLPALAIAAPMENNDIPNLSIRSFGYNPGDITISQANTSGNGW